MSTAPSAVPEQAPSTLPHTYDPDFDRRWSAWVAKGALQDAQGRTRRLVGLVLAVAAFAAVVASQFFAA